MKKPYTQSIIKRITLLLMKYNLKVAKKRVSKEENTIMKRAFSDLIKSYETTIMFLEADS